MTFGLKILIHFQPEISHPYLKVALFMVGASNTFGHKADVQCGKSRPQSLLEKLTQKRMSV